MRNALVGSVLLVALVAFGGPAEAQRRGRRNPARDEALQLFQQSEQEYQAGRFAEAAALLERAWHLYEEPVLMYNLGRAWEGAGEPEKAFAAYQQYLEAAPRAPDRTTVEAKIAELRRQIEARQEAERRQAQEDERIRRRQDEEERREDEQERRERERRAQLEAGGSGPGIAPWILVGAGGVAIGAGGLFGVLANSQHDDADHEPVQQTAQDKQETAQTLATLANVAFVAGAVMAAGGVTWALLGGRDDDDAGGEENLGDDDDFQEVRGPTLRIAFGPGSILLHGTLP